MGFLLEYFLGWWLLLLSSSSSLVVFVFFLLVLVIFRGLHLHVGVGGLSLLDFLVFCCLWRFC